MTTLIATQPNTSKYFRNISSLRDAMANTTKPLTATEVDSAKTKEKEYSLFDGRGLALRVRLNGKSWRFSYTRPYTSKRSSISFGTYPEVSLKQARDLAHSARELLAKKIDPKEEREKVSSSKSAALNNTFRLVALSWFDIHKVKIADKTARNLLNSLNNHVFPAIGDLPIDTLTAVNVISALKPLADKGTAETVIKLCQRINNIMTFALNTGVIESNRLAGIKEAFAVPVVVNLPAIKPQELPELMRKITLANIKQTTRCLMEFQLHTMVRPSEAAGAKWSEIDFDKRLWTIPAERMKKRNAHLVPLSDQVLTLLNIMQTVGAKSEYIFPADKKPNKHANNQTVNKALERMGYKSRLCSHGLRTVASTTLNEQGHDFDIVEAALAHVQQGVRAVYNRTDYIERRRVMMAYWSNHIDNAATGNMSLSGTVQGLKVVNG